MLDTNVLLHDPRALFVFQENNVVLPLAVVEEIDDQKRRQDEIGRNARTVSRERDALRALGSLAQGVAVPPPRGGSLRIELNHSELAQGFPEVLSLEKADNRILSVAFNLMRSSEGPVVLVSKELNLRLKADVMGIAAEDFRNDKVDYDALYTGVREVTLSAEEIEQFYRDGQLRLSGRRRSLPQQFMVLRCREKPSLSALARHADGVLKPLQHAEGECLGIKGPQQGATLRPGTAARRRDQGCVPGRTGRHGQDPAGPGRRPGKGHRAEELHEAHGHPAGGAHGQRPGLPARGEKEDKLRPWMQPLYDNLESLFRDYPVSGGKTGKVFGAQEYLLAQGLLEIEALTYIRGRSIPRQFIICDEAQNRTPHMVKTLVTRVGEGTKIVFTGDPEQIDHPYLDSSSNGLSFLVERLNPEALAGHVTLVKGERSRVAELGARLL